MTERKLLTFSGETETARNVRFFLARKSKIQNISHRTHVGSCAPAFHKLRPR